MGERLVAALAASAYSCSSILNRDCSCRPSRTWQVPRLSPAWLQGFGLQTWPHRGGEAIRATLLEDSPYLSKGEAIRAISCWRIVHV